jgi:hypothetical protein
MFSNDSAQAVAFLRLQKLARTAHRDGARESKVSLTPIFLFWRFIRWR